MAPHLSLLEVGLSYPLVNNICIPKDPSPVVVSTFTRVKIDSLNLVMNPAGKNLNHSPRHFVDNKLIAETYRRIIDLTHRITGSCCMILGHPAPPSTFQVYPRTSTSKRPLITWKIWA